MIEVIATVGWVALGILAVLMAQDRMPPSDRRYVWLCLWAHVASVFILVWLVRNFLGGGDIDMYYYYGEVLADFIRRDPARWGPEVAYLVLQMDADLPIRLYSEEGSSTASLIGMTALILVVNGGSEYGTAMFFSLLAFSGQFGIYAAFRDHFPPAYRGRVLLATLLVPSVVFWTSGVVKEAVAIAGIGWVVWGIQRWIVDKERIGSTLWIAVGAVVVSISKAFVLFPLAIAAAVWWFWEHSLSTRGSVAVAKKPLQLAAATLVAIVGLIGLGELFPEYSVESLGEETAQMQRAGAGAEGGSNYVMGDPDETSLTGQLAFAPVALVATLFRPFIVEAHNFVALVNGLEMTVVLIFWIWILKARGLRGSWHVIRGSPALVFCVVFVLLCALGVGLATTNLGTLSRYRVPMMPTYILVLLVLVPNKKHREESPARR